MTNNYLGEIRPFAGSFAPLGWHFCDGSLLAISENDALYAVIGTTYGGDGVSTFGLPDLQGRVAVHQGTGNGLSPRVIGQKAGEEQVSLLANNLPAHSHTLNATNTNATNQAVAGNLLPATPTANNAKLYTTQGAAPIPDSLSQRAVGMTGGSQSHENRMPSLAISYIIALVGIFPTQN